MSSSQFQTFANSPKSQFRQRLSNPPFSSDRSNNHLLTNIPELKQQMQEIINSPKHTRSKERANSRYPSEVSLLMSDVFLISTFSNDDAPFDLLHLEVELTQEILALREDKITLMQEYNRALSERFQSERSVLRLKKKETQESNETEDYLSSDFQITQSPKLSESLDPIEKKNEKLKTEYQQWQTKGRNTERQSEEKYIYEIEIIQKKCQQIEEEIARLENKEDGFQEQRFETFFPNKNGNKQESLPQRNQLMELKQKRAALYKRLTSKQPDDELKSYLLELMTQNQGLQEKADALLAHPKNRLQLLKARVIKQGQQQLIFFEDLKIFKQNMATLKQENERLKNKL